MIITQTPLRVSFLGGGTDYPEYFQNHGGAVIGTAIDKSVFFSMSRYYSQLTNFNIRVSYKRVETCRSLDELRHRPFRECMRWCNITKDVEINHFAELPSFTGLGSSSAFVVGLLNTLNAYQGKLVPPIELAYQAIEIERNILDESVGCQDQTFAAVGGINHIEFRALDNIVVNRIPMSMERIEELESHLLVFFTGIKRRAEEMEARQVKRIGQNHRHLSAMQKLVDKGLTLLVNNGSIVEFGKLLHTAWQHKRELDARISNDTIDQIYLDGIEAGAVGGKLLGAGGGGFMLFFAPPEKQDALRQKLKHLKEVHIRINAPGSHVVYSEK